MSGKIINSGLESQAKIIEGVEKAVNAIKVTLGPSGKAVAIGLDPMVNDAPEVSRDGATVAKSISFKDQALNMGAQLVKKAASLTEEQVGDATSSCSILVNEFCKKGQRYLKTGSNVNEIKSGMLKAGKWMTKYIASKAIPIDGDLEKIRRVATISANNDPEIGELVVRCMEEVGINGIITADITSSLETEINVTTGMKLERGWASPQYVTSPEDGKCVLEDPHILIIGERVSSVPQILPIIEEDIKAGKPFLVICDEMDDVVNATLVMNNLNGAIRCCVVKGIDFGDSRKNIMQDIAVAVGGKYISQESGNPLANATIESLGTAKRVVISRDNTIIYQGAGRSEDIVARAEILRKRLEDPTTTNYDKTKFEKRIANLIGGIGIIKAGGATETEKLNRKATIEDAILASKSAISEGCVPGGGYIYLKGAKEMSKDKDFWKDLTEDEKNGANIIMESLPIILSTIISNSGKSDPSVVVRDIEKSTKEYFGYNAKTGKYCNLIEDGVLDSAKVIRVALENAISTASMILLIDCTIIEEPETKE